MAETKTNGQTELVFLMDVSEPMADFASDIIAGFNGMIARLREEETDILVTTWQFADFCLYVDERVPITADSVRMEQDFFERLRIMREQVARQAAPAPITLEDGKPGRRVLINAIGGVVCRARYVYKHYPENPAQFACDAAGVRENFASLGAMILEFSATGIVAPTWAQKISEHLAQSKDRRS